MLLTNVFLIDNFFKQYETTDFSNRLLIGRTFWKEAPVHFYRLSRLPTNIPTVLANIIEDRKISGS